MARRPRRRARPVAAFDLDGSLVREQLIILLFREFFELGVFSKDTQVTFDNLFIDHRDRRISFHEYDEQLVRLFNRRIRGKYPEDMRSAAKRVAEKHRDWLYTFSRALLDHLRPTHQCITVTGALHEVVTELAPYWGFEEVYASKLEIRNGKYTGQEIDLPVLDKRAALLKHVTRRDQCATLDGSVGIGDTRADVTLLAEVDVPVAFNPSDTLATEAEKRGWPIVLERKDCIYVICGDDGRRFRITDVAEAVRHVIALNAGRKGRRAHG